MNKSIYEEAFEDLYYVIPVGYPKDMIGKTTQTKRLLDFVKQAQKQEKLLELYKEINNKRKELITLARHNTWSWKLDIEIKEIQDKIEGEENA